MLAVAWRPGATNSAGRASPNPRPPSAPVDWVPQENLSCRAARCGAIIVNGRNANGPFTGQAGGETPRGAVEETTRRRRPQGAGLSAATRSSWACGTRLDRPQALDGRRSAAAVAALIQGRGARDNLGAAVGRLSIMTTDNLSQARHPAQAKIGEGDNVNLETASSRVRALIAAGHGGRCSASSSPTAKVPGGVWQKAAVRCPPTSAGIASPSTGGGTPRPATP